MSTPQSGPTRKQQKVRATRKLAEWRKKQAAAKTTTPTKATTSAAATK
jgi:hypothetical protein